MVDKSKRRSKKKTKNIAYGIVGALLLTGVVLALYFSLSPESPFVATPTVNASTFKGVSAVDLEDCSDFVEGSIWVPKSSATFDETEDIYTLTNFEETKSSMDLEDISIDLSGVTYAWLEIDPDGESVFSNTFYLLYGGANYKYTFTLFDLTTDVNFNMVDEDTMAVVDLSGDNVSLTGGYEILLDCPHYTTTSAQLHVGTNWDMEQSDFDDLSTSQKNVYYDEKNWAGQYPLYDPAVDLEKEFHSDLEKITNAFALKFDFNATISTVDGNSAQVNVTIASDHDIECVISGDLIYFIWYEAIEFDDGAVAIYFDMDTASGIGLDDIDSGRIVVPRDDDALGTFTKYSDIGA